MDSLVLYVFIILAIVCFLYCFEKISDIESKIGAGGTSNIDPKRVISHELALSSDANKFCEEINEMKKLKEHISNLPLSGSFIASCIKKINSEIDYEEWIYYRKLGQEVHKNTEQWENIRE